MDFDEDKDPLVAQSADAGNVKFLTKLTSIAAIGGFLFGYDTGVIGGANIFIEDDFGIGATLLETIVSMAIVGAVIGSLIAGPFSDKLGRKPTIQIADICFTCGAVIMAFAPNVGVLIAGRFVVGLGVGIAAMIVPVYLAEAAPPHIRGRLVATNVLFITGGQVISYCICLACGSNWRLMLGLAGIPSIVQFFGMFLLPESPRWLMRQGREDQAVETLMKIRLQPDNQDPALIQPEINEIKLALESDLKEPYCASIRLLFDESRAAAITGVGIAALQQFCGINTAMYYGPQIMQEAGFNTSKSLTIVTAIPMAAVNFLGTIFNVTYIDNLGRRKMLLWTIPPMICMLLGLAVAFGLINFSSYVPVGQWMAIICACLFVGFFAIGLGAIPWIVNSEIYPLHLRSIANSVSTTANWIANFIVSMSFLTMMSTPTGQVYAWIIISFFATFTWFWVFIRLPETKGKKLEDIILLFKGPKNSAVNAEE